MQAWTRNHFRVKVISTKAYIISYPITGAELQHVIHASKLTYRLGEAELENMCIVDGNIEASTFCFENVDKRLVSAIVLAEGNGRIIQFQTPALGLEQKHTDLCVTLQGFCLYAQDLPDYGKVEDVCADADPCLIVSKLECCLLELALDKESKAGFSYKDTSMTFRKPDVVFIEKMLDLYKAKCAQKHCKGGNQRRFRIPLC